MSQWLNSIINGQNDLKNDSVELHKEPFLAMECADFSCVANFAHVIEVIEMQEIVAYPEQHEVHIGILNLRGEIIPVLCLRKLLFPYKKGDAIQITHGKIVIFRSNHGSFAAPVENVRKVIIDAEKLALGDQVEIENQIFRQLTDDFFNSVQELSS